MSLPFFYAADLSALGTAMILDEATSKHCIQVLRMREGDALLLTDGKGLKMTATIKAAQKRHCEVVLTNPVWQAKGGPEVYIGISPLKNTSRLEWFLEKATELGVAGIIPLLCERTERQTFRYDRMSNILVSAMLQSQQSWLPLLRQVTPLPEVLADPGVPVKGVPIKYIAHCLPGEKTGVHRQESPCILLIGPEGDFTPAEIEEAFLREWMPVTLGETRLRTETAGMVASTLLRLG